MARKKSRRRRSAARYALKISGRVRRFRTKTAAKKAWKSAVKRGKKVRGHVIKATTKRTTKRRSRKTTRRKARRTTRRKAGRSSSRRTTRRRAKRTTKRRARKGRKTTKRRAKGRRTTRRRARRTTRHGVKRRKSKAWRGRTKYGHPKREVFGFKSPNTGAYWSVTEENGKYVVREETAGGRTKHKRRIKSEAKALQVVWKWIGKSEPELKMAANRRRRGRKTTRRAHRRTTRRVKRRVTRRRGRRTTRRR